MTEGSVQGCSIGDVANSKCPMLIIPKVQLCLRVTHISATALARYPQKLGKVFLREGIWNYQHLHRRCRKCLFKLLHSGRFTFLVVFRRSDSMRNNTTFSWGVVKSNPRVWIWKYLYFKWGARLHLDGFWVIISLYTIFQAFRTLKDVFGKFNINLWKIWW